MTAQLKREAGTTYGTNYLHPPVTNTFSFQIQFICILGSSTVCLSPLLRNTITCRYYLYAKQIISATIFFTVSLSLCPIQKVSVTVCDCERCLGTFWKVNAESWQNFTFGNCILTVCSSFLTNGWWILTQMWLVVYSRFQEAIKSKNKLNNEHPNDKPYFSRCLLCTYFYALSQLPETHHNNSWTQ